MIHFVTFLKILMMSLSPSTAGGGVDCGGHTWTYCRSRPSQARPGRLLVDLQSNLGLGEELELLRSAPSCCLCQGSANFEEHEELQVLLQSCIDSGTILTRIGMPLDLGY